MKDLIEINSAHASFSFGVSVREKEHMIPKIMGSGVIETMLES